MDAMDPNNMSPDATGVDTGLPPVTLAADSTFDGNSAAMAAGMEGGVEDGATAMPMPPMEATAMPMPPMEATAMPMPPMDAMDPNNMSPDATGVDTGLPTMDPNNMSPDATYVDPANMGTPAAD